jgi:hypothetical protein
VPASIVFIPGFHSAHGKAARRLFHTDTVAHEIYLDAWDGSEIATSSFADGGNPSAAFLHDTNPELNAV